MTQTIPTFSLDFEATKVSKYFVSGDHLEGIVRDQLRNEGAGRNLAMGNVHMIRDHENVCVPGLGIVTLEENPDLENVDGRGLGSVSGLDQETAMIEYDHDPRLLQGEELETEDTTDRLLDEGSHFHVAKTFHTDDTMVASTITLKSFEYEVNLVEPVNDMMFFVVVLRFISTDNGRSNSCL